MSQLTTISNWAHTHTATPEFFHTPSALPALQALVRAAAARGATLRVVGAAHSPSDCAMAHGPRCEMLSLVNLCSIHSIDAATGAVDVDAGITLAALNGALAARGLALPNLGSISEQTVGGCIATGTHGTGARDGLLSSCITALTLVAADGSLQHAAAGSALLPAALCSLGLLGIVVRVQLRAVPAFHLHVREAPVALGELLRSLPARVASSRHYRFWWFPHTGRAWEWRGDPMAPPKVLELPRGPFAAVWRARNWGCSAVSGWVRGRFFGFHCLQAALWLSLRAPWLVPRINSVWGWALFGAPRESCVRSDAAFNFDCLFQQCVVVVVVVVVLLPGLLASAQRMACVCWRMCAQNLTTNLQTAPFTTILQTRG